MAFNLGNYASRLDADVYNQALSNAGSAYRLPAQQQAGGDMSGSGWAQASQEHMPQQTQWQQSTPQEKTSMVGGLLGGGGGGNKLGGILNLVGSFYGGGVAKAAKGVNTAQSSRSGNRTSAIGSLLGGG